MNINASASIHVHPFGTPPTFDFVSGSGHASSGTLWLYFARLPDLVACAAFGSVDEAVAYGQSIIDGARAWAKANPKESAELGETLDPETIEASRYFGRAVPELQTLSQDTLSQDAILEIVRDDRR